jgi:CheY-like chemotaxis protein
MTSDSTSRKTVLFVDDDEPFLEVLQPYMERLSAGGWTVLVANDSSGTMRALDTNHVDLAVLDVRMPVVDGVQLLQLINRKHPHLKKAVLSGFLDDECRAHAFQGGAELVLEKPSDASGYEALYSALNELVRLPVEQGFRGMLRRVGIEDIIQMECLSRHSLILEVTSRGQRGRIYIRSGSLIHAECGGVTGEAGLQKLLTLTGGEFKHLPFTDPPRETLEGSWEFLLLEAVRQRDEAAGGEVGITDEMPTADLFQSGMAIPQTPEPIVSTEAEPSEAMPVINELVVCSDTGEVIYEVGSTNPSARSEICKAAAGGAVKIQSLIPVGTLERIEFLSEPGRVIARFQDGQSLFLRADAPS